MKQTSAEFTRNQFKRCPDSIPEIVLDGWVFQVSEAIKRGDAVPDKVLSSVDSIYFNDKGNAFYK